MFKTSCCAVLVVVVIVLLSTVSTSFASQGVTGDASLVINFDAHSQDALQADLVNPLDGSDWGVWGFGQTSGQGVNGWSEVVVGPAYSHTNKDGKTIQLAVGYGRETIGPAGRRWGVKVAGSAPIKNSGGATINGEYLGTFGESGPNYQTHVWLQSGAGFMAGIFSRTEFGRGPMVGWSLRHWQAEVDFLNQGRGPILTTSYLF